jgi:hypothetical protein
MDPNSNLQELLDICTEAIGLTEELNNDAVDAGDLTAVCDRFVEMTRLFEALNEWIRKGGFLPEVWQVEQDKLASEYFRAELSERFPWLLEISKDGTPTEDYEEPSCVDAVDALTCLWAEVISSTTIKPALVPLYLGERRMLIAMMEKFRENIGQPGWDIGYGEDDLYSGSFDIIRKLDGQPEPPETGTVTEPQPARFQTEDGYVLIWDNVNRQWSNGDFTCPPAGWSWWPVDFRGKPMPGSLME